MLTCFLMGGLGNQLFQIFATMSYALTYGHKFVFLDQDILYDGNPDTTIRYTYWKTFFTWLSFAVVPKLSSPHVLKEKDFTFNDEDIRLNLYLERDKTKVYMLRGYYQSYKYFANHYHTICRLMGMQKLKLDLQRKLNPPYSQEFLSSAISMHFRIGDYKGLQEFHPLMSQQYYERCLHYIQSQPTTTDVRTVLYFCEDADLNYVQNMIDALKVLFPMYSFERGDNTLVDWEQMMLMSLCGHNIIANSSFSWWGAYFNEAQDKIVCYPSKWFGPAAPHDTQDLCPPSWKCIEN